MIDEDKLKFLKEDPKNVYEEIEKIKSVVYRFETELEMNWGTHNGVMLKTAIDYQFIRILEVLKLTGVPLDDDLLQWKLEKFKERGDYVL